MFWVVVLLKDIQTLEVNHGKSLSQMHNVRIQWLTKVPGVLGMSTCCVGVMHLAKQNLGRRIKTKGYYKWL